MPDSHFNYLIINTPKYLVAVLVCCCISISGIKAATSSVEDSLRAALIQTHSPDGKIKVYIALAENVKDRSADSCLIYLNEAEKYLLQTDSIPYMGKISELRGDIAQRQGDLHGAMQFYNEAIDCYDKAGEIKPQAKILNSLGANYSYSGNLPESFRCYYKAKEIAEEFKDELLLARINNNIGRIFIAVRQLQTGIEYYNRSLPVFVAEGDSFRMATVMMNLSSAYNHLAKTDSSIYYAEKTIDIFSRINRKYYLGTSYEVLAFSLITEGKYEEALQWLNKALMIALEEGRNAQWLESKMLLSDALVYTGVANQLKGDYQTARTYLFSGLALSDSLGLNDKKSVALEYLALNYENSGNKDSSLFYYKAFKKVADSLYKMQSVNFVKLEEVQMEFEQQAKEKKLQAKHHKAIQKRNLIIFTGSGLVLLSVLLILLLRLRIERQKKRQIELEKRQAELEKEAVDAQLQFRNKELAAKVLHSARSHELVINVAEKLKKMEVEETSVNYRIRNELIHDLINSTQDEDNWKEFELRFQDVHSGFYAHLRDRFPDLTPSEIRLSALLRLNMTTKEISALTHQSERAIILARHRLRHKLGLQTSDNLVIFLAQF
jgi:tetratricopeptide (TPR) repeat protein/DNA-binding CsgD family transcriptional regulator